MRRREVKDHRVGYFLLSFVLYFLALNLSVTAQGAKVAHHLKKKNVFSSDGKPNTRDTEIQIPEARISFYYSGGLLATVHVVLRKIGTKQDYRNLLLLLDKIQPLGSFKNDEPVGTIEPAGWVSKKERFSKANIVIKEQSCVLQDDTECGLTELTVFYWLPLHGTVTSRRIVIATVKGFASVTRYLVTVRGVEVMVLASDYERLRLGKFARLNYTLSNEISRVFSK